MIHNISVCCCHWFFVVVVAVYFVLSLKNMTAHVLPPGLWAK